MGQVYTGNLNFYRYWGYWYDYPLAAESYAPSAGDVTGTTTFIDMPNAGLVDSGDSDFNNDGVFEDVETAVNVEFQDATDKNEDTNGGSTDEDVFIMRVAETHDSTE